MTLHKSFFERPTNITAKVICDSVSPDGIRMTTLEVEYPRFIHGEVMTHRTLSKNSSSSRAIPVTKMLEQIENNMAIPVYWGKNKSGMQAVEEIGAFDQCKAVLRWEQSFHYIKDKVESMVELGLHKQVPNRLSEPFQMMKVVISGTDWENFFNLRIHKDAQPEICMLAYKIYKAMEESTPTHLREGEWHLPYLNTERNYDHEDDDYTGDIVYFTGSISDNNLSQPLTLDEAIKISASCCAQVSYRNTDMTLEKADKIFNMLVKADVLHASCFEHLATPIRDQSKNVNGWDEGITHVNKQGQLCSGNLRGYVQYRHLLTSNTCYRFNFEERMKSFV